jgi:hypothetical protein
MRKKAVLIPTLCLAGIALVGASFALLFSVSALPEPGKA